MMARRTRPLFTKWALLNGLLAVGVAGLAAHYGSRVHGASLISIPAIVIAYLYASTLGGRIAWDADSTPRPNASTRDYLWEKRARDLLHRAHWLGFWAWTCQILGILSTVFGFWLLLSQGGDTTTLGHRIQNGGGVALTGTFVGILCSLALQMQQRLIEHDVGG